MNYKYEHITGHPQRTVGQMFFKPFTSKEFIFCMGRAVTGSLLLTAFAFIPVATLITSAVVLGLGVLAATFKCDVELKLLNGLSQCFINALTAPAALILMCTRGFSTLLQATGVYDYDAASCSAAS